MWRRGARCIYEIDLLAIRLKLSVQVVDECLVACRIDEIAELDAQVLELRRSRLAVTIVHIRLLILIRVAVVVIRIDVQIAAIVLIGGQYLYTTIASSSSTATTAATGVFDVGVVVVGVVVVGVDVVAAAVVSRVVFVTAADAVVVFVVARRCC